MARFSRTPASLFAFGFGIIYLIAGGVGFALTGMHGVTELRAPLLGVFMVNPLHNMLHLAVGVAWLCAAPRHRAARIANLTIGCAFGLLTVLGATGALTVLAVNGLGDPDNFLHLGTAALALYFGSVGAEKLSTSESATSSSV